MKVKNGAITCLQSSLSRYTSKRVKITISKRCLCIYIHCSINHYDKDKKKHRSVHQWMNVLRNYNTFHKDDLYTGVWKTCYYYLPQH